MAGGVAVMGAFSPKGDIPGNPRCNGRDMLGKHMQTNVMRQQDSHSNRVHDVASRGNPSGHICAHHTLLGGGAVVTRDSNMRQSNMQPAASPPHMIYGVIIEM